MKKYIRKLLGLAGYEIRRKFNPDSIDPFDVQKSLIQNDEPVIFDVGASVGSVTQIYRDLFPRSVIHSFEPFAHSFAELEKCTANDRRTSVYNVAVSDKQGSVVFNINSFAPTSSLLATDNQASRYWGEGLLTTESQVQVDSITVDSFRRENAIGDVDILKLDIQGGEFLALRGAQETLESQLVSIIYSEIIVAPTYQDQQKLHVYLAFLDSVNYELFDIYNPVRNDKQLMQADFLFVSRNHLSSVVT